MTHFKTLCRACSSLVNQCRCPSLDKEVRYVSTCARCVIGPEPKRPHDLKLCERCGAPRESGHMPRGWYGGTKFLERCVAIGAFNFLDLEELKEHLAGIAWEYPEHVQLLTQVEDDYVFLSWCLPR